MPPHPRVVTLTTASASQRLAFGLAAATVFLLISWSPEHYWDEFFYLFSAAWHSPRELVRFEGAQGIFPNGFFSGKIGHVVLLRLVLDGLGLGRTSLFLVQSLYALLCLGFAAAAWRLLRELLDPGSAGRAAVVLLFLPVTVYLGFKTLSEVPSLLFTTLGCWAFLRSFRHGRTASRTLLLALAASSLALGTLCRVTGIVTFAGLVIALTASRDPRFRPGEVTRRSAPVIALALLLYGLGLGEAGGSLSQLASLAQHVISRPGAGLQRLYALALTLQAFALVVPFGLRWRGPPLARLMTVWLAVTALPCLLVYEPRYYAPALIPLAVVSGLGIGRIAGAIPVGNRGRSWVLVLALLVLADRAVFAPLMPFEVDQRRLSAVMEHLEKSAPGGTYLVPWFSDYAFLRIAFPHARVRLCITAMPESRYTAGGRAGPMPSRDRWWLDPGGYVGSRDALRSEPRPWYFIGWTYNPSLVRLRDNLTALGIQWAGDPERAGWHNHLAGSWIWGDRGLTLTPAEREGQYQVFRVATGRRELPRRP